MPPRACQNCGAPLHGPYCANCGQHDIEYHRSFHHLTHDLLENLFHFDGKFLVSVAWMLAKPGRLTAEFNAGRRASQVPPLRFYIFVTVLFFLGVHLLNHGHLFAVRRDTDKVVAEMRDNVAKYQPPADFTRKQKTELLKRASKGVAESGGEFDPEALARIVDAIRAEAKQPAPEREEAARQSAISLAFQEKLKSGELTPSRFLEAFESRVPTLLFLGMPIFALILKILYLGSRRYYIEHLIFSVHLHTWVFIVLMVGSGYLRLAGLAAGWLQALVVFGLVMWAVWYVFTAFRTVYGQAKTTTALKAAIATTFYGVVLMFLMTALVFLTLAWLVYVD